MYLLPFALSWCILDVHQFPFAPWYLENHLILPYITIRTKVFHLLSTKGKTDAESMQTLNGCNHDHIAMFLPLYHQNALLHGRVQSHGQSSLCRDVCWLQNDVFWQECGGFQDQLTIPLKTTRNAIDCQVDASTSSLWLICILLQLKDLQDWVVQVVIVFGYADICRSASLHHCSHQDQKLRLILICDPRVFSFHALLGKKRSHRHILG